LNTIEQYDYVIAGSGAAGLMLAYRMSQDSYFDHKKVLLIDRFVKNTDDRTWCFWEEGTGEWDHLMSKTWGKIYFGSQDFKKDIDLGTYHYKMLRSSDFYAFVHNILRDKHNFELVIDAITHLSEVDNLVHIHTDQKIFAGKKVFNSIFDPSVIATLPEFPYLKQHFIGWFVKTDLPVFDDTKATFMDFTVDQKGNTRFMYVLPTTPYEALVEYTLFSEHLLDKSEYEAEIKQYLTKIGISNYVITETEMGNIPMTSYPFERHNTSNIMYIGSAGGWTKASTGFTFASTTRKTKELVSFLKKESDLSRFYHRNRYWYYDLIFLDVLYRNNEVGSDVFSSIFRRNSLKKIFQFLDENNTIPGDIKIMLKTRPMWLFTKSAFLNLIKMFKRY
jgi:lycopene beta-cyclase